MTVVASSRPWGPEKPAGETTTLAHRQGSWGTVLSACPSRVFTPLAPLLVLCPHIPYLLMWGGCRALSPDHSSFYHFPRELVHLHSHLCASLLALFPELQATCLQRLTQTLAFLQTPHSFLQYTFTERPPCPKCWRRGRWKTHSFPCRAYISPSASTFSPQPAAVNDYSTPPDL